MARGLFSITPPRNIKAYLFLAFSAVLLALFLFNNVLISRLAQQTERTSRVFARFCATASVPAAQDTLYEAILAEVIQGINFPIVLTDVEGVPRAWKEIGIDPASVPDRSIDSLANGLAISPVIAERIDRVRQAAERLDRQHDPITLIEPIQNREVGLVHWGEPTTLQLLRFVPYLSLGVIGILLGLTFWGARGIRLAEARSIWVGLAKETAHQLGTPLSSLMGWVELLRGKLEGGPPDRPLEVDRRFLEQTVEEMQHDVERLNKVAARFSQIGSVPALQPMELAPVVSEAVHYVQRRTPHLGRAIRISERYEETPPVNLNPELMQWVVENLLVNAVNAMESGEGRIEVTVTRRPESESVELEITDNGSGMTPEVQKRAFETGFSTRKRGWGLGLALAKRIVEDYHGGRIFVRRSAPGEGSVFVVSFPT